MAAVASPPFQQARPDRGSDVENDDEEKYSLPVSEDSLPSAATLDDCGDLNVQDENGQSRTFRSLYEEGPQRTLIVFVRHFFCGMCQEYLRSISSSITAKDLQALPQPTQLIVIGCGSSDLIKTYASASDSGFPIYADPSRKLYDTLGMTTTLTLGPKPQYQATGTFDLIARSIVQTLSSGSGMFKSGPYNQIGGEFLFQDGKVVWCHRMSTTRDHTETNDLRRVLGFST